MNTPAIMSFSGGKDSVYALYRNSLSGEFSIQALVATISRDFDRVSMHGVRRELLEYQAAALGLPLELVYVAAATDNRQYVERTNAAFSIWRQRSVEHVMFGDLFLEDLRAWRQRQLAAIGMRGAYPIWRMDTTAVARDFITLGFRAVLVCVDTGKLPAAFAGREFDNHLLTDLPPGVDPCGENGEFHTFVYDGPLFQKAVPIAPGQTVIRGQFSYRDLLPAGPMPSIGRS